jgi:hypothetical protein
MAVSQKMFEISARKIRVTAATAMGPVGENAT